MKYNNSPNDTVVHPHYDEGTHQYNLKIEDIANGLESAGYNIKDNDNKNWWEDEDLADAISYRLEIHRDNISFNGDNTITLSAKLYSNNAEITDTIPPANFIWTRVSGNTEKNKLEDKYWNEQHSTGSKSITLTKDDVDLHAQFTVSFVKYEDDTAWIKNIYDSYIKNK